MERIPLVSVIIPAYNHQDYIEQCIKSIFAQTYPFIEVIVLDDGSTDNTYKVLQNLQKSYSFKLLRQSNQGLVKTLINAIEYANGFYISPLGSDDFLHPDKISEQVKYLESNIDIAAVTCNIFEVDKAGRKIGKQNLPNACTYAFEDMLLGKYYFPAPGIMFRKSVYQEVGGYDPWVEIEDWSLLLKITDAGYKIHRLVSCLAYYRIHDSNMHLAVEKMAKRQFLIINKYKSHPLYKQAKSRWAAIAFNSLATKHKRKALTWASEAVYYPFSIPFLKGIIKFLLTY